MLLILINQKKINKNWSCKKKVSLQTFWNKTSRTACSRKQRRWKPAGKVRSCQPLFCNAQGSSF